MLCERNYDATYYALFIACIAACEKVSHNDLAVASMCAQRGELACIPEVKVGICRWLVQRKGHTVGLLPGSRFQCGAGQPVPPRRLRRFPVIILDTESHGGNSKKHNYPRPRDYSLYYGAHLRISQPPQEITWQAAQPNSRPATWAVQPPTPTMPPSQMEQTRAPQGF